MRCVKCPRWLPAAWTLCMLIWTLHYCTTAPLLPSTNIFIVIFTIMKICENFRHFPLVCTDCDHHVVYCFGNSNPIPPRCSGDCVQIVWSPHPAPLCRSPVIRLLVITLSSYQVIKPNGVTICPPPLSSSPRPSLNQIWGRHQIGRARAAASRTKRQWRSYFNITVLLFMVNDFWCR